MILLALAFSALQAHAQPFEVLNQDSLPAMGTPTSKTISLQLVVEAGTKWDNKTTLEETIAKTAKILSRCGIGLGETEIRTVKFEAGLADRLNNASPYKAPAEIEIAQGDISPTRPVFFLVGTSIGEKTIAKALNKKLVDTYSNYFPNDPVDSLLNLGLVSQHYITNSINPAATSTYNTFAHELVHLLTNDSHINVRRNLMSNFAGRGMQTGDLTDGQCQQMMAFPH